MSHSSFIHFRRVVIGHPTSKVLSHRGIPFTSADAEADIDGDIFDEHLSDDFGYAEDQHGRTAESNSKLYHCTKCNVAFTRKNLLNDHVKRGTCAKQEFWCRPCKIEFKNKKELSNHIVTEGCGNLFKCSVCDAFSKTRKNLIVHMRSHTLPPRANTYECPQCDLSFYCNDRLLFHMTLHKTKECPFFKCKTCDKTFTLKLKLLEHRNRVHIEGKQDVESHLLCEICGKWLATASTLQVHLMIHNNIKSFQCSICGFKCVTECNLKTHMKSHTKVKPFQCDVCGKNFSRKENMKTHYTIHTGELKYKCNICGKKCSRSDNLATHLKMHARKKQVASQRN